jgi:hypothetical protein
MVRFYPHAITPACATALEYLRRQPLLRGYYLAGGTALALQISHRISTDLDWFSSAHRLESPERDAWRGALSASADFVVTVERDGQTF